MNELPPAGCSCLSDLLRANEMDPPEAELFSQKTGSEFRESNAGVNPPDSPAQNETTRMPVRAIPPQSEVVVRKDEKSLVENEDEVKKKNEVRTAETEGGVLINENNVQPGNEDPESFDPFSLRLSQDYAALAATKKIVTTIPIRKPNRQWFFQVHPKWSIEIAILEAEDGSSRGEPYIVTPELFPTLSTEAKQKILFVAINRQGTVFLWPVKLPPEDGPLDAWNQSALVAAERAKTCWIRLVANMEIGAYDLYEAQGDLPEPSWSTDLDLKKILKIAFNGRIINSLDHPVLRRLRGEL